MGLSGSSKDVLVVATLNPHSLLVCLQAIGSNWKEVSAAAGTLLDWGPAVGPHSSQGTYGLVFAVSELPPHSSFLPSHSTLPLYPPHSLTPYLTPLFLPTSLHSYSPPHFTLPPPLLLLPPPFMCIGSVLCH